MFVTLEKFFNDYRIKNGQAPNETVMNRGTMRLKREIRELKTYYDLMQGNSIDQWDENRIYEIDEFVEYQGWIYRSKIDGNYADIPSEAETWELFSYKRIEDNYLTLKSNIFTSEEDQSVFKLDFNSSTVVVFLDGVLQDQDVYNFEPGVVSFLTPLEAGRTVTILSSIGYEADLLLPKKEFKAEQDQYEFEVDFDLTDPSVFVDGKLVPEKDYIYEKRKVILETPVDEGIYVVVCNGNTLGSQMYTKSEIDELLSHFFKDGDVYSKTEVDNIITYTLNDISNLYRLKSESYSIFEVDNKFTNYYTKSEVDELISSQYFDTLAGYGITDAYTKTQCDALFAKKADLNQLRIDLDGKADKANTLIGYGIQDAYTKDEVDNKLNNKADSADTLLGYGIQDAYTKDEVDALLRDVTITVDDLDLSEYAKKATTLAGYGIQDTYTKPEIDELLANKQDLIDLEDIDAKYLNGFSANQFLRKDIEEQQYSGVSFYSKIDIEDRSSIVAVPEDIPEITLEYKSRSTTNKDRRYFAVDERVLSTINSNDLYFIADGDFKGTWFESIYHFGILLPQEYNWFVNVFPLMDGDSQSFVPTSYNSGQTFNKYEHDKTEYESSYYHFGFIDGDQVKMYSYYKSGSEFIPTYAHYQLIGVKKAISTHVRFNQGDQPLQPIQFNHIDDLDMAAITVQNAQKNINTANQPTTNIENDNSLINDSVQTTSENGKLYVSTSENEITNDMQFFIIARNGIPGAPVTFVISGDGESIQVDTVFNEVGCATMIGKGKSPYTEAITVQAVSEGRRSDYAVINMKNQMIDDPNTTLNWDNTGWDYTVFSITDENLYSDDPETTLNWDNNGFDNTVFGNKGN